MKRSIARRLAHRKRPIKQRLALANREKYQRSAAAAGPVLDPPGMNRVRGIAYGGVGPLVTLAHEVGLVEPTDRGWHLMVIRVTIYESDHVLNPALNALCDATCLQDLERRRNDAVFLDGVGTKAIPDPTTAGDWCRLFDA
ncbi:MAG: hypothetical protein L0211_26130 [Planctomycetaceae bacterium]|nr:hypothetical protein [Planctomycetaceae bacterium]